MTRRHNTLTAVIATLTAAGAASTTAQAQERETSASTGRIDEVIVTARRREENLQDVALSIAAMSDVELEMKSVELGRDLGALVPNFQVGRGSATSNDDNLVMRGMPGVGIYVDGIWQGTRGFMVGGIVEMERVELLRGPQGTLFGRDTNGGAIQYITRRPAPQFGARVNASIGNYNRRHFSGSVDLPLTDTLLTKFTAASRKKDGWLKSLAIDRSYGHENDQAFRGDVLWVPTESFSARLVASSEDIETTYERQVRFQVPWPEEGRKAWNECCWTLLYNVAMRNPAYGPYTFWQGPFPNVNFPMKEYTPYSNEAAYPGGQVGPWETNSVQPGDSQTFNIEQLTLTLEWDINSTFTLKSLTGIREQNGHSFIDLDASPLVLTEDMRFNKDEWLQQEFHLQGAFFDERLDFLLGAFWAESTNYERLYRWRFQEFFVQDANGNPTPNLQLRDFIRAWARANNNAEFRNWSPGNPFQGGTFQKQETTDKALFGETNYKLTDKWLVTAGMRFSWKDSTSSTYQASEAHRTWLAPGQGGGRAPGDLWAGVVTASETPDLAGGIFTPKLATSYRFREGLMAYVSYAEGYTSAERTFVEVLNDYVDLDPEVVSTYELGLRSDWLDNRLRVNATAFFNKWTGIRVPMHVAPPGQPDLFTNVTTSAGKAEAKGADIDVVYSPIDPLSLNISVGLLDTKYTEVGIASLSGLRPGLPFAFAPKFSGAIGAQYSHGMPNGGELMFRVDYGYKDEYQRAASVQRQPPFPEPGYGMLSARIRYGAPDDNWSVSLFGTNLTNERYVDSGITSPPIGLDLIQVGPPRQIGLTLGFSFK